jgi:hypothetical protein
MFGARWQGELDGLGRRAHLLVLQGRSPRIAADLRIYRGQGDRVGRLAGRLEAAHSEMY